LCRNVSPLQVLNQEKSGVLCSGISGDLCSGISGVLSSGIGGVLCSGIVVHFVAESWRPLQQYSIRLPLFFSDGALCTAIGIGAALIACFSRS